MKTIGKFTITFFSLLIFQGLYAQEKDDMIWKAGTARAVITPVSSVWMAGYSARDKPSEGIFHDLWAKALVLEDVHGNQALLITTDLIGFDRQFSNDISDRLKEKFGLKRSEIILSSSHTHSGPVINDNLKYIYPPFDKHMTESLKQNKQFVLRQILVAAERAMSNLAPATVLSGNGIARFAVNRRENTPEDVLYGSELAGPSDHTVNVILVRNANGKPMSVVFGYACHATCLSLNNFSGDYPGFAQIELEKEYPGAIAMFFAGCGSDQNPIPRRTVPLTKQYGKELAVAVARTIDEPMKALKAELFTRYNEIPLDFNPLPSQDKLDEYIEGDQDYLRQWAESMKGRMLKGEKFPKAYEYYPIQTWQIGEQPLVVLGGEVVVDYAIKLKSLIGNELMVMAYANDVMAYIPTERVLTEGGYEGESSMMVYNQPSTWTPGLEKKIIDEVIRQVNALKKSSGLKTMR